MRVFLVVIDGFGVDALPCKENNEIQPNSFVNLSNKLLLHIPTLKKMGISNIDGIDCEDNTEVIGSYGKSAALTTGNDSISTHWEMAIAPPKGEFKSFENEEDLPLEITSTFSRLVKAESLCNKCVLSEMDAIGIFGQSHIDSRRPILFSTGKNLVVACHEDVFNEGELDDMTKMLCDLALESVGKITSIIFNGAIGRFYKVSRKDYILKPSSDNMLKKIKDANLDMIGIGKIGELFPKEYLTNVVMSKTNQLAQKAVLMLAHSGFKNGLLFANLPDTDSAFGHKNDFLGYRKSLEETDAFLAELIAQFNDDDVLIVTSDHGNDPTLDIVEHTREYVPILCYGKRIKNGHNLGTLPSLSCIGHTILELLEIENNDNSFKGEMYEI